MNNSTFKNIAKLIQTKRLISGLSQVELSNKLGYKNGQFISNVERSLCGIPNKKVSEVCNILNFNPSEVLQAKISDCRDTFHKQAV